MKKIYTAKLSRATPLQMLSGMKGMFEVVFDDNSVEVIDAHELVVSRYLWEICYQYNIPITKDLRISNFYESGFFTASTHRDFFSYWYKRYVKEYLEPQNKLTFGAMNASWKTMVEILNRYYSELQFHILEYGVSLSIFDYIDLQKDPDLEKSIEEALNDRLNPSRVEVVTEMVKQVVLKNPNNNLSKLFNSGVANKTQVTHSIGIRGFVTDIQNMVYSELVGANLTKGLDTFYDISCESSSMGKALTLQEFGVRYSEWLQREMHLVSMNIRELVLGDCGNRYYHEWGVDNKATLSLLEGSNVLIDGVEQELDSSKHSHLIGSMIKMRRLNDCLHLKEGKVCHKCLGALSYSIPEHGSPAHILLTELMAKIGQLMLSAKHYTESAVLKTLRLDSLAARYLRVDESNFYIRDDLDKNKKYTIVLSSDSYYGFRLLSTSMADKIDTLDISKLSTIDGLFMKTSKGDSKEFTREYIEIRQDGRSGVLDKAFIAHSLSNTVITANGEYEIDITNYRGRLLYLENKEFAFDQYNADFKKLLLSYKGKKRIAPEIAIVEIFQYLNQKLSINMKIVEMLVAAITVENLKDDFSVGLNRDTRSVSTYRNILLSRSPGISLGFAEQKSILNTATNYVNRLNPYNPLENVWNMKNIQFRQIQ